MDLRQFLRTLARRWKFIGVLLLIGVIASVVLTERMATTYESTTRVFFSTQANTTLDALQGGFLSAQRVVSYAEFIDDPQLLGNVIERLDLDLTPDELADDISAENQLNTVVIEITARAEHPRQAQRIADTVADEMRLLVNELERPDDPEAPPLITARLAGEASYQPDAVSPQPVLNIGVGALLGLLIGVSGAVVRELLDTSVSSPEAVHESTGSAVLATVPFDAGVDTAPLISDPGASVELSESFRVLRTNLQFIDLDASRRVLVVSSAIPNEGKTTVSANLAVALAQNGQTVLVIDCDFRHPQMAGLLGLENAVGLSTVLVGRTTLAQAVQEHRSGVMFLGTGRVPPNPSEILETQAMRDLLAEAGAAYDVVVIDAPPLLPVTDPAIIASQADGVLLVARYGQTTREHLRLAAERIAGVSGRIYGAVLNMTPRRGPAAYGYGYGYGYGTAPAGERAPDRATRRAARKADRQGRKADQRRGGRSARREKPAGRGAGASKQSSHRG